MRLLLLVSALGAAHAQLMPNSPWPMRGQNLRHTANGLVAPPDNSVVVVKYKTGGPISSSPAVDADGTVYFLSTDGFLYALEADGITLKWKYQPFDTSKVTEMYHMFSGATAFNQLLSFDTSKVWDVRGMFYNAKAFNQALRFDTSKATWANRDMFYGTSGTCPWTCKTHFVGVAGAACPPQWLPLIMASSIMEQPPQSPPSPPSPPASEADGAGGRRSRRPTMGLIIAGLLCGAGLTTVVAGLLTIVAWMLTGDDGGNRVGRFAVALRLAIFSRESLGPAVFGGIDGIITTYSVIVTGVGGMMAVGLVIKMAVSNLITDGWSMGFGQYMAQMAERSRENADYEAQRKSMVQQSMAQEHGAAGGIVQSRQEYIRVLVKDGMNDEDATTVADIYEKQGRRRLLEELSKKELGQEYKYKPGENDFVRQLANAVVMMLSFVICGAIPVIAYSVGITAGIDSGLDLLALNSVCSIIALFVLGMIADRVHTPHHLTSLTPYHLTTFSPYHLTT